jgi:NTP pyrophosphatase (non-canonical NTP hydrolase)
MCKYKKAMKEQAEYFGLDNRMLQCTEELSELVQALCKYRRIIDGDKTCIVNVTEAKQMVAEEIADVEICIEQLKYLLCNKEQVERRKKQKIKRTQERLNK